MKQPEGIACPICRKANPDFERINRKINQARTPAEKASFAGELIKKVEAVLEGHQMPGNILTEACRTLLDLRKQTAELILKFQK